MTSKEYFSARYIVEDYKTVHKNSVLIVNGKYIENIVPIETITKDSSKINELGWFSEVSLDDGLIKTYEWFLKNN